MSGVGEGSASVGPLSTELREVAHLWSRSQHRLVVLAAAFADSSEWVVAGSPTAAHWLAGVCDVEVCTAREWIRVGRRLRDLPLTGAAFDDGRLSYSKVRSLTRVAEPETEAELLAIAEDVPAGGLHRAIAAWLLDHLGPDELAEHHQRQRSVQRRVEPDGMVTFMMRLRPAVAALLMARLDALVSKAGRSATQRGRHASAGGWPSMAQQRADAFERLLEAGAGTVDTEVVFHVRGDGCTLDDGTPIPDSEVGRLMPAAFIRALIHDAERRPINASGRQRHPTTRQKRVVKERDRVCVDCGSTDLGEYDHVPPYEETGHTVVDELVYRCPPCHHKRHGR